jgi:hypothetical protein
MNDQMQGYLDGVRDVEGGFYYHVYVVEDAAYKVGYNEGVTAALEAQRKAGV